jgi:hypothetical protein
MRDSEIFISYAWKGESEILVDRICDAFASKGYQVTRDKSTLTYKDSIREFMDRIGRGKYIIAVVSDKYMKSEYCMFEAYRMFQSAAFKERVFPIVLPDTDIFSFRGQTSYLRYWDQEYKALEADYKSIAHASPTMVAPLTERLRDLEATTRFINDFMAAISDMNVLTSQMHLESNFDQLLTAIEARIQAADGKHREIDMVISPKTTEAKLPVHAPVLQTPSYINSISPPTRPKYYFRPILSWLAVYPEKLQELTPFITLMLKIYTLLLISLVTLYGVGRLFPEVLKFIPSIMSEMGLQMTFMKIYPLLGPSFIASLISYILLILAKAKLLDKQIILSILLGSSLLSLAYIFCIFTLLLTDNPVAHIVALIIISIAFVILFFKYSNIEYYWVKKTLGDFTLEFIVMIIFVWCMAQLFYNAISGGTT